MRHKKPIRKGDKVKIRKRFSIYNVISLDSDKDVYSKKISFTETFKVKHLRRPFNKSSIKKKINRREDHWSSVEVCDRFMILQRNEKLLYHNDYDKSKR